MRFRMRPIPLGWLAMAALAFGTFLRVEAIVSHPGHPLQTCDGAAYWNMAQNFAAGNGFAITDPEVAERLCRLAYGPSHHYSPLLPAIEAGFIWGLGPSVLSLSCALLFVSLGTVAVVYVTTRDLFGDLAGRLVAGAFALEWTTIHYGTLQGYSENLVVATLMLTLWAIVRSLEDERMIVWAGVFAGFGYLSKGSVGWFFLLAGLGGVAWRLVHRGLAAFRSAWYGVGILAFLTFFLTWTVRNLVHFWDGTWPGFWLAWPTSVVIMSDVQRALAQPGRLLQGIGVKIVVILPLAAAALLPLSTRIRGGMRSWREEAVSALWLASLLVFLLGWFLAACLWVAEGSNPWWADPVRYVVPAAFPLFWLAVQDRSAPQRAVPWLLVFVISYGLLRVIPRLMEWGAPLGGAP